MNANFVSVEYKEVEVFNGTSRELENRSKNYAVYQKAFHIFYLVLCVILIVGLSTLEIFESSTWSTVFRVIGLLVFLLDIFIILDSRIFSDKKEIKQFTFDIESIEYTSENQMFVNAYNVNDEKKTSKYKFKFDRYMDFPWDFFTLFVIKTTGGNKFFYCRKEVK